MGDREVWVVTMDGRTLGVADTLKRAQAMIKSRTFDMQKAWGDVVVQYREACSLEGRLERYTYRTAHSEGVIDIERTTINMMMWRHEQRMTIKEMVD